MKRRKQIARTWPEHAIADYVVAVGVILAGVRDYAMTRVRLDAPKAITGVPYRIDIAALEDVCAHVAASTSEFSESLVQELTGISVDEIRLKGWDVSARVTLNDWASENVQRIVTVAEKMHGALAEDIADNLASGGRADDLAASVTERFGVAESDAERICVTETLQLNSTLNTQRMLDIGVERFIWRCVDPCDECAPFDGETYSFRDPPEQGMPGFVHPRCKCYQDPITDESEAA